MKKLPEFPGCFVCGRNNARGLHVPFSADATGSRAAFRPDELLEGYAQTVHGGIICALLDEAVIWAAYGAKERFGVTAELNVRFRQPMAIGKEYSITGQMLHARERVWIMESQITDEGGDLIASANAKVVPVKST